ncbi:PD-(D/E)XK nuclease family transposase [Listeria sp. PSOL-1]|uniref:PD-(D/E)XK nuclease family transposase n=1 Tax=Listeria sp. PSOL-1 TaxID=1844999 RepID=UPI0013D6EEC3|nr:PD-(D/E)XK nuclease family transposase [Listeria sp. PSOL-1]
MAEQRWTAKNDLLFKKVFASPKWRHILIGFIQDILNLDVEDVTIDNPYSIETFYKASKEENKLFYTEVDVLARLADGTLVTIEIQVNPQSYFKERALYYLADKYVSNYGR